MKQSCQPSTERITTLAFCVSWSIQRWRHDWTHQFCWTCNVRPINVRLSVISCIDAYITCITYEFWHLWWEAANKHQTVAMEEEWGLNGSKKHFKNKLRTKASHCATDVMWCRRVYEVYTLKSNQLYWYNWILILLVTARLCWSWILSYFAVVVSRRASFSGLICSLFPISCFISFSTLFFLYGFCHFNRYTIVRYITYTWLRLSATWRHWSLAKMWCGLESAQHANMAKRRRRSTGNLILFRHCNWNWNIHIACAHRENSPIFSTKQHLLLPISTAVFSVPVDFWNGVLCFFLLSLFDFSSCAYFAYISYFHFLVVLPIICYDSLWNEVKEHFFPFSFLSAVDFFFVIYVCEHFLAFITIALDLLNEYDVVSHYIRSVQSPRVHVYLNNLSCPI